MLHDDQRTSAPSSVSVSMSTAVWIVMCKQPAILAPLSGLVAPYLARSAINPGISFSARLISLRPQSARDRSATLKSCLVTGWIFDTVLLADIALARTLDSYSRVVRMVCGN